MEKMGIESGFAALRANALPSRPTRQLCGECKDEFFMSFKMSNKALHMHTHNCVRSAV